MLRRLPAPNLVQNFLPTATAGPGLASLLADGVSPGVQFFLAVCHNADALPEGQVTSHADAFREIEYLNTPCSLFGSGPIFAKCRGDNGEETDRESRTFSVLGPLEERSYHLNVLKECDALKRDDRIRIRRIRCDWRTTRRPWPIKRSVSVTTTTKDLISFLKIWRNSPER